MGSDPNHQLRFTPQLQQAIRILQMSRQELYAEIRSELATNRLIQGVVPEEAEAPQADVHIRRVGDRYTVEPDPHAIPKLTLNSGIDRSHHDKTLVDATWFFKGIQQRQITICRVTEALARHQAEFLAGGPARLRPVAIDELATELELTSSLVEKAVAHKYVQTPHGLCSLEALVSGEWAQV